MLHTCLEEVPLSCVCMGAPGTAHCRIEDFMRPLAIRHAAFGAWQPDTWQSCGCKYQRKEAPVLFCTENGCCVLSSPTNSHC